MSLRSEITIDTKKIIKNIDRIKEKYSGKIYAVVKANAYGLGAVKISETIENEVNGFCVATVEEGIELRENGIKGEIIVLGYVTGCDYHLSSLYDLSINVVSDESAKELIHHIGYKLPNYYVSIDTGMHRFGVSEEWIKELLSQVDTNQSFRGFLTHYYNGRSETVAGKQENVFLNRSSKSTKFLKTQFALSSAATDAVLSNCARFDFCRVGMGLYGISEKSLFCAVRFVAYLVRIFEIQPGDSVGYGATFYAQKRSKVGVVSCGYADGYPFALGNTGVVFVDGAPAKVIGMVCMDYFMIELPHDIICKVGDEVLLFGEENRESFFKNGLSPYSFLCGVGQRTNRRYI